MDKKKNEKLEKVISELKNHMNNNLHGEMTVVLKDGYPIRTKTFTDNKI
ncbi:MULTISPECIES: hypothetical protein [Psychrilyobacter]|nr:MULTISPECIES: hypothetical protein [Psychrilyobacter]MCS5420756.1 hypothetical protein [Psychrilyobacter sp. S5]NDI77450.1 hypothetical protein [Psychrilyobacter piezotolerans]